VYCVPEARTARIPSVSSAIPAVGSPCSARAPPYYATHKHAKVRAWLERHKRWTFHYTPTSASWLNAVEGAQAGD
jgi:hypothetical protein